MCNAVYALVYLKSYLPIFEPVFMIVNNFLDFLSTCKYNQLQKPV